ncbi:MAG: transglutaminase domain-containing protein, partial [Oscillospiraceae bacterium]|nr:transglutaminase domain-containing protein [Oscillospiraceae bacterium]
VVYTDFSVAVILLALILPKPSTAPYYEKFEELTNRFQIGGTNESAYIGQYKDYSGVTDDLRRGESVLLYAVSTPSPVYMKTQTFDIYDAVNGVWTEADKMIGSKYWQKNAPLLNYEKLGNAAEKLMSGSDFAQLYSVAEAESYATVYSNNYPAVYVLAPLRATKLVLSNINAEYSARTKKGEIFTNNRLMPSDANYTIRFYTEDIFDTLISKGACDTTTEEYGLALEELYFTAEEGTEELDVLEQFRDMHLDAVEYAEKTVTDVSPEIQALADEITAGLEYDYQKAEAIEKYFHKSGFKYDLMYEPPEEDDTPEYFLFESKTGICSDFATAYTLLARAAGLTVRYVEGFVMQPSESTPNMYFIYTDNAHAYPEVYIPGAGWMVYEPTPSSIVAAGEENDNKEARTDPMTFLFTAIIAVAVIGAVILIAVLVPKILEAAFRIRVKLSASSRAVIMMYNRHAANMEHKLENSCKALTPEQLNAYTEEQTALTLEPLTRPFVKACYGGMEIERKEKSEAFECYKAQ